MPSCLGRKQSFPPHRTMSSSKFLGCFSCCPREAEFQSTSESKPESKSKSKSFTITVQAGHPSGVPPNRRWGASSSWEVEVNRTDTIRELLERIRDKTGKRDLSLRTLFLRKGKEWNPSESDPDQTVDQTGLSKVLSFACLVGLDTKNPIPFMMQGAVLGFPDDLMD